MAKVSLNADVLRLIVQEAARSTTSSSSIEAFHQRSSTLRRLSLVESRWRALAQLELERVVVLTTRNFASVSKAVLDERRAFASRVRKLVDKRGTATRDRKKFEEVIERCKGLRELECHGSRLSLDSLRFLRDLRSLSLTNTKIEPARDDERRSGGLPFHLRSFMLAGTSSLGPNDWKTLKEAGASTLEHLELRGRMLPSSSQCAGVIGALSVWLETVRTLDIADLLDSTRVVVPALANCRNLEQVAVNLSDFPQFVDSVSHCAPQHVEVVASSDVVDEWTFLDYQSNVLFAIGKAPFDRVETVKVSRAPGIDDSAGSRETALFVKVGKRKTKHARVVDKSLC